MYPQPLNDNITLPSQGDDPSTPCLAKASLKELVDLSSWWKITPKLEDRRWISLKRNCNFHGFTFRLDTHAMALEKSLSIISSPWNSLEKHKRASKIANTSASLESHMVWGLFTSQKRLSSLNWIKEITVAQVRQVWEVSWIEWLLPSNKKYKKEKRKTWKRHRFLLSPK